MKNRNYATPYLFLALPVIIITIFTYVPIVLNLGYSLFEWSAFSGNKNFVGFENYIQAFTDPVFYIALKNNLYYAIFSFIFQVCGGLVLAAILEDKILRKISTFLRTIFFIPVLLSITVVALLFTLVYNPQIGLLNTFLEMIGLSELTAAWLGNTDTAIFAVIAVSQWQNIGYIALLFIISIQKIPEELYDAAKIDGASKLKQFFHVTLPGVKEMGFVATIITLTQAYMVFNEPYILTGGGPGSSSEVLSTFLYNAAFNEDMMGYASTIATVILVITMIIALFQMKIFKTGEEGEQ